MEEDIDPLTLELRDNPSARLQNLLTNERSQELAAELGLGAKDARELQRQIEHRLRQDARRR